MAFRNLCSPLFRYLTRGSPFHKTCFGDNAPLGINYSNGLTEWRCFSTSKIRQSENKSPQGKNRKARLELAVAYRSLASYNLHEGVCNHLSLMAPAANSDGEVMLIIPYGLHWSQVTASSLLGVNMDKKIVEGHGDLEISAASIHLGLHKDVKKATCVMHTHAPYATSLGVLKDPSLVMCHQNSLRFYNRVAYDHRYQGLAKDVDEGRRLASLLEGKDIMIMCNHGVLTLGSTVASAFDLMYYLERACMFQMIAMATSKELSIVPDDMATSFAKVIREGEDYYAQSHFKGMINKLLKDCPDVAD